MTDNILTRLWNTLTPTPRLQAPITDDTETIRYGQASLTVRKDNSATEETLRETGTYEPWVSEQIQETLTHGDTAIDIGAHVGHHTLAMRQQVGKDGTVISVEPHPDRATMLKQNIAQNNYTNITVVTSPVSDKHRLVSLTETGSPRITTTGTTQQATTTLRSLLNTLDTSITLLKLDVEGHEHVILPNTPIDDVTNLILEYHDHTFLSNHETNTAGIANTLTSYPTIQTKNGPVHNVNNHLKGLETPRDILLCTQ